jgi:hypothetical protein
MKYACNLTALGGVIMVSCETKKIVCLAVAFAFIWRAQGALVFFGGVTDPGLPNNDWFPVQWPDTKFTSLRIYNEATAQDSCSSYQQLDGNDPGYGSLHAWMSWIDQNRFYTIWYGGWGAAAASVFDGMSMSDFTKYVATMARQPGFQGSNVYINFANEPMHGTGLAHNKSDHPFVAAMGGPGSTGYDWLIKIGKIFRQYFPNAKLGVNDFSWESSANDLPGGYGDGSISYLSTMMNIVKVLKNAGVIDWVGAEGYGLESVASANLTSALNQMGSLGVQIIFTEFTPGAYKPSYDAEAQLGYWQSLLPAIASNQYVIGVVGPWSYLRSDTIGNGWFVDNRQSPWVVEPVVGWLKSYLPTVIASPTSTPTPKPTPTQEPTVTPSQTRERRRPRLRARDFVDLLKTTAQPPNHFRFKTIS